MSQVKGIPYGISDFNRMRNENFYFVDKTMYAPYRGNAQLPFPYSSETFRKKLIPKHDAYLLRHNTEG